MGPSFLAYHQVKSIFSASTAGFEMIILGRFAVFLINSSALAIIIYDLPTPAGPTAIVIFSLIKLINNFVFYFYTLHACEGFFKSHLL
jgi:hypothetical protein